MSEHEQYIIPLNQLKAIFLLEEIQRSGACNKEMLADVLKQLPDGTLKDDLGAAITPKEGGKPKGNIW